MRTTTYDLVWYDRVGNLKAETFKTRAEAEARQLDIETRHHMEGWNDPGSTVIERHHIVV